jgi:TetR/AcrR family transcriptional regulator, regulator of cefoperazone and chloramphenicol sensitivity
MKAARRHNAETAYPRGEETRARIISAAMQLFGEKGFDGVTTREIATLAEVPAPSLQYYFVNKEGLYKACVEHLQTNAQNVLSPAVDNALALLKSDAGTEQLIEAYCSFLDCLADFLLGSPDAASRALFIARWRMTSEAALKKASKDAFRTRMLDCCYALVLRISGDTMAKDEAQLVVATINGQLMTFHFAREHMKILVGWDDFTPARMQKLKQLLRQQTTAILKLHKRERT